MNNGKMNELESYSMIDADFLKRKIYEAFCDVSYPGDEHLKDSNEGEKPYLLERDFRDKDKWQSLDAAFLDQAPDGYASALSFFSNEAFRFYLPAYLIADLNNALQSADPVLHLCFGLDDTYANQPINPRRYGDRTWFAEKQHKFAVFTAPEVAVIVAYLAYKATQDDFQRPMIEQALHNYWL